jgi:hypothetical protein
MPMLEFMRPQPLPLVQLTPTPPLLELLHPSRLEVETRLFCRGGVCRL